MLCYPKQILLKYKGPEVLHYMRGDLRINVGAHRDVDFMKQMEVIDSLSWSDTLRRFHDFEKATIEFGKALSPLMDAGLRQIGASFMGSGNGA